MLPGRLYALAVSTTLARLAWNSNPYPVHLGTVETHYASLSHAYGAYPLRSTPIRIAYFFLGGPSEFAARLPTTLLLFPTIILAYVVARYAWGERAAWWSSVAVALNPLVFSYYGRVMPDAYLTTGLLLVTFALTNLKHLPWALLPGVLLGVLSKPVSALYVLQAMVRAPWTILVVGPIVVPVVLLLVGDYDYAFSRFQDGHFLGAWPSTLAAITLGLAPLAWWWTITPSKWTIPIIAWLAYALVDAYPYHEYYALPGVTLAAVASGPWLAAHARVAVRLVPVALLVTSGTLVSHGVFDDRLAVSEDLPEGARVWAPSDWQGPLGWYNPSVEWVERGEAEYVVSWHVEDGCGEYAARSYFGERVVVSQC